MQYLSKAVIVLCVMLTATLLIPSRAKVSATINPAANAVLHSQETPSSAAMLLSPPNGQTTDDVHQLFAWQAQTPAGRGLVRYQLKVAEVVGAQTPELAVQFNQPHLLKTNLPQTAYELSNSDTPFVTGRKYAWQVTAYQDGSLFKQSEVRSFNFVESAGNARIGLPFPTVACSYCANNGLFESGSLNNLPGWSGLTGHHLASGTTMDSIGFVNGRHTLMTCPGVDPVLAPLGISLPLVNEGTYSFRLGNSSANPGNEEAEQLRYTFVVNGAKPSFTFSYAVVLNDGGHPAADQPFFRYRVYTGASWNAGVQIAEFKRAADPNDPYFKTINNSSVLYRGWDCETINLQGFAGQQVTIEFETADCYYSTGGGHFGYAYIDGFCDDLLKAAFTMPDEACASGPIWIDASASMGETDYFVSVEKSDQWWGRPDPTQEVMHWFTASEAGKINLTDFYKTYGANNADKGEFKCDSYYRIKIAVRNHCVPWKDITKLIHIKPCPIADAGPDRAICCANSQPVQIGTPAVAGYTYSWTSNPAGFTSNQAQPSVKPSCDTTYTVTVTGPNGCSTTDGVNVLVSGTFKVSITQTEAADVCEQSVTLSAIVEKESCSGGNCALTGRDYAAYTKILWSTGETTPSITVKAYATQTYSVTVSNACGTKTTQITVPKIWGFNGAGSQLIYPNAFTPNGDGLNDIFTIYEYGLGAGEGPAYNALEWQLSVYDRWGGLIYQRQAKAANSKGFKNGDIGWDGRPNGSNTIVQIGVYNWVLEIKNCSYKAGWVRVGLGSVSVIK